MKSEPQPSDREVLAGLVERVTYQNAENGFCVIRVKARGHRDLVTLVGHAAAISAGEWITASGDWTNDRTHGQQFKARFLKTSAPTSLDGIEKYLASGMIRGIGPVYAKKLLRAFGEKVFDVIEAEPDRLREVDGIGPVRANRIAAAWAEQKVVREIMVFLHSHGVGSARAVRIRSAGFRTNSASRSSAAMAASVSSDCAAKGIKVGCDHWHADHKTPHAKGGNGVVLNGQVACRECI
jgi:exodeoxyribonuclease V alpha subunit